MKFAFEWAKNRFNINNIDPADLLFYYKKGHKVKIPLRDMESLISKILNYS
jgi:hypothetical protein